MGRRAGAESGHTKNDNAPETGAPVGIAKRITARTVSRVGSILMRRTPLPRLPRVLRRQGFRVSFCRLRPKRMSEV